MTMPEPMDPRDFAGPHPTCREFVAKLAAWGFTKRRDENVHTLYRGPHGGTLRVIRSELGRADPAVAEKAARLACVTAAQLFAGHHGYEIRLRYELSDSAWKSGGGREYQRALKQALADAHAGKFKVLIVWALDRIVRDDEGGAEAALRIIRLFRQAGVMVVSVQEPWLNGAGEVQDVLVAFAGWVAQRESARKSERIRNGLSRRRAEGKPVGRQPGAADKKKRKRSGYVASWEGGARRAAYNARTAAGHEVV